MSEERAKYGTPPKQLNIRLPVQVHRELKAKSALQGRSLVEVIDGLIRGYLSGEFKLPEVVPGSGENSEERSIERGGGGGQS